MKKHYFLIATTVIFTTESQLERSKLINILATHDDMNWNVGKLGHAQNMALQRYHQTHDPEIKTKVNDVFIQNISYVGHMTQEEWLGQTEIMADPAPDIQEKVLVTEQPVENITGAEMQDLDPRYGTDDANKQAQGRGE